MSDQTRGQITFELPGHDKKFRAKELTVKQIRGIFEFDQLPEGDDLDTIIQHFGGTLLPLTTNLTIEELEDMRPSELKLIWEKVREVNAVFFDIANAAGIQKLAAQFKDAILADFLSSFVSSLSAGIRSRSSSTSDTPTSSEQ
jgi:hypothetical protein